MECVNLLLYLVFLLSIYIFNVNAQNIPSIEILKQLSLENIVNKNSLKATANEQCSNHFNLVVDSLQSETWAMQMFDASTKFPDSVLMGLTTQLGNFDECIGIQNVLTEYGPFNGQHCLASLVLPSADYSEERSDFVYKQHEILQLKAQRMGSGGIPALAMGLQVSYCVPSTCSGQDFETVFNEYLSSSMFLGDMNITVQVPNEMCQTSQGKELSTGDWIVVALLLIIAFLAITSTAYDLFKAGSKNKLYTAFSWYSNGKKLLSTNSSSDTLEAIHGIRFLSICWVVLGHRFLNTVNSPSIINKLVVMDWVPDFWRLYVTNATVSVDTFFFLSGLLVCYIFLKQMNKEKARFNIPLYYFHRYVRLTPPFAMTILLTATLLRYLSSGPLIRTATEGPAKPCHENWWTNLLYVNNYVESDNMCLGHTWYLAIDMQLFLLSPIILYPLWKWPRKWSLTLLGALIVGGLITAFVVCFVEEFSGSFISQNLDQMYYQYFPTHTRFAPWLIGVGFGYLFHETKKNNLKLSKMMVFLGWCIGLTALLGSFFGAHPFNQLDKLEISGYEDKGPKDFLTKFETSIYVALSRSAWALGVGWVTYACIFGYGGPVNTFLSWKFFQPLSRLSYGIYLLHGSFQNLQIFSARTPIYISDLELISNFFSDMVISAFFAAVLSLCVESPIIVLEQQFLTGGGRSRDKKENLWRQTVTLPESKEIDVDLNSELQEVKTEISNEMITNKK